MQTNDIASLLVDCTAQIDAAAQTPCFTPTQASVGFDSTLALATAALETQDGQILPTGESEAEELAAESAEMGNCLALTWMTAPQVMAPPAVSVSIPSYPTLAPAADTDTVQHSIHESTHDAILEAPTLEFDTLPASAVPVVPEASLPTPAVSNSDPKIPNTAPQGATPLERSVAEDAPVLPGTREARVERTSIEKVSNRRIKNED